MNTIPTIFNEKITPYTAVGGKERVASNGISAVILNRPGTPKRIFLQELEKTGFDNVISIESAAPHYDIEEMASRYPFVRFILPEKEINTGEQINLAASEIESPLFFVLRSDMKIIAGGTARRMAERLMDIQEPAPSLNSQRAKFRELEAGSPLPEQDENGEKKNGLKRLCTVPIIVNSSYETIPSLITPWTKRKKMQTSAMLPQIEGQLSLYPFDGVGIYDRRRFIHTGGFDSTIKNTHWQFMDFGFRAHLWGEEISLNQHFKVLYEGEISAVNFAYDSSYRRFYLKNLAPVFKSDYAHLPLYRFPSFLFNTGESIINAWKEFRESRFWVIKNKFRWKLDARGVTHKWDNFTSAEQTN